MSKIAKIHIFDEVNAAVLQLDKMSSDYLFNKYGILTKSYFFSAKYKLGIWDGKIRYFHKTGNTYVQLLPEIISDLKKLGWSFELIDKRNEFQIDIPQIDKHYLKHYPSPLDPSKPLELGDHQVNAVNAATGSNMGIILASTGAGKSIIAAILCELYKIHANFKCIVIVPTVDLVDQTKTVIQKYGNDVGEYSGTTKDIDHDHLVTTWQALQNNKDIVALYQVVIVDECHGVKSSILKSIINEPGGNVPVKIGLTGTLPKDPCEQMDVRISLGNVLYTIPAHELIDAGWLAKLKLKIIKLIEDVNNKWEEYKLEYPVEAAKINAKKFKEELFPDYDSEKSYLQNKNDRNDFIVNIIDMARVRGNCLVLTNGIPFGKKLSKKIPNSYFVYGKDKKEVRKEIYKLFETNDDIVVVTSYQLASTGLDIPRIFNLFLIDSGNSFIRVIQSIGRGLRKAMDKNTVYVYDICSDLKYSSKHYKDRKKYYKEQQYTFTEESIEYQDIDLT